MMAIIFYAIAFVMLSCSQALAIPVTLKTSLAWTDNADNETGQRVYQKIGSQPYEMIAEFGPNVIGYTTAQFVVEEGTAICYQVSAFNEAGESAKSNEACKSALLPAAQPLPLIFVSSGNDFPKYKTYVAALAKPAGATSAVLSMRVFDADFTTEGELWINQNGPIALFPNATADSNQIEKVVEFEVPLTYFIDGDNRFVFVHKETSGFEIRSVSVVFTVPPPLPTPATNLTASIDASLQVKLSWSDASSNEDGFKILRNGQQIATVPANATSYTDDLSGQPAGAQFSYSVIAFNVTGDSAASNTQSVTVPVIVTIPRPPSSATITIIINME